MCMICKDVDWPWAPDTVFSHIAFDSSDASCTLSLSVPAFHPAFLLHIPEADAYHCTDREGQGFPGFPFASPAISHHPRQFWCHSLLESHPQANPCTNRLYPRFLPPAKPRVWSGTFLPPPFSEAAARAFAEGFQHKCCSVTVQWQFLQTRVSLIQELKEQTSERQFGWITGEQYPEIYISDST